MPIFALPFFLISPIPASCISNCVHTLIVQESECSEKHLLQTHKRDSLFFTSICVSIQTCFAEQKNINRQVIDNENKKYFFMQFHSSSMETIIYVYIIFSFEKKCHVCQLLNGFLIITFFPSDFLLQKIVLSNAINDKSKVIFFPQKAHELKTVWESLVGWSELDRKSSTCQTYRWEKPTCDFTFQNNSRMSDHFFA